MIGTQMGNLEVWNFKSLTDTDLIHQYQPHCRKITGLKKHPKNENLFICSSQSGSIGVYCLDKFVCQYNYQLPLGDLRSVGLYGRNLVVTLKKSSLQVYKLSYLQSLVITNMMKTKKIGVLHTNFEGNTQKALSFFA